MFDKLMQFQERILALLDRSEAVLRSQGDPDIALLGQTRWELARVLREYQLMKHGQLFDRFERGTDERAQRARRMKAECIRAGEKFRDYILRWSVVSILDEWDDYVPAALESIERIRALLAREREGMAYLLNIRRNAA